MTRSAASRPFEVVPHDDAWVWIFEAERRQLEALLGPAALAIHHIGSTSVPELCAKPVIDILVETSGLESIDLKTPALERAGYEVRGEYGIPGRRYFSRPASETHLAVHVHVFEAKSVHIERHLLFRDYLRAHPVDAAKYGDLKRRLATEHPQDRQAYQEGKAEFIRRLNSSAKQWRSRWADSASSPATSNNPA